MSALTPIAFPEQPDPTPETGAFPYSPFSVTADTPTTTQNATRMQQLEKMLEETRDRAEIVEKEAYDKAYLAGEKAGMALGEKRAQQILDSTQESLKKTESELAAIQQTFAEAALELGQFIAEQIVGSAVENDNARLLEMAENAAAQLPADSELRIAISPDDYLSFKQLLEESKVQLILSSNASVKPGTCRIISTQQDILIDPVAAVGDYLERLRPALITRANHEQSRLKDEQSD